MIILEKLVVIILELISLIKKLLTGKEQYVFPGKRSLAIFS